MYTHTHTLSRSFVRSIHPSSLPLPSYREPQLFPHFHIGCPLMASVPSHSFPPSSLAHLFPGLGAFALRSFSSRERERERDKGRKRQRLDSTFVHSARRLSLRNAPRQQYVYTSKYKCIHTYIHTYIHTCVCACIPRKQGLSSGRPGQTNAMQRNATQRNATQCNATQRNAMQCLLL